MAARDLNSGVIQALRPIVEQALVTLDSSDQETAAFNGRTRVIRVYLYDAAEVITNFARVILGPTGTATTANSMILPVNTIEYFSVQPGEVLVINGAAAAGVLNVTEMA